MAALYIGFGILCVITLANFVLVFTVIYDLDRLWRKIGGRR